MSGREHHLETRRTGRFFTLGGDADILDCWFVCHGYGQLAGDFLAAFEPIASPNRLIVAPEALSRFYLGRVEGSHASARIGASWMTRADREAEIADQIAWLDRVRESVAPPSHARVRVLGFSQGAATVVRWLAGGATRCDDLILWAGDVPGELAAVHDRLPGATVHLVRGDRDPLIPAAHFESAASRVRALWPAAQVHAFPGDHRLDPDLLGTLASA